MSNKEKKYYEYMKKITPEELFQGLLGYGLFPEKVPPMFTTSFFPEYFRKNKADKQFFPDKKKYQYAFYASMRNTNVPRIMGIPVPFGYARVCDFLQENWGDLCEYFKQKTEHQEYKISRIHIRKMQNSKSLFQMNYHLPQDLGTPEDDLLLGSYYKVKADISQCFPSMYSHALAWAIMGKKEAKKDHKHGLGNELDEISRTIKDSETNGFLIGPHVSNLLSEIILSAVDSYLTQNYDFRYIRNIDDFTCYTESYSSAECFLIRLEEQLKEYGLSLNHKKTQIIKLPCGQEDSWIRKLKNYFAYNANDVLTYPQIRSFMDFIIDLVTKYENSAIINYAMKVIAKKNLNDEAREYYIKIILHLSTIYTYLIHYLDKYLFESFIVPTRQIKELCRLLYLKGINALDAETVSYSLFFAIKYNFEIKKFDIHDILSLNDCILYTIAWKYAKQNGQDLSLFIEKAKELKRDNDFDKFWVFAYEVLDEKELLNEWRLLKKEGYSFIKKDNEIAPQASYSFESIDFNWSWKCNTECFKKLYKKITKLMRIEKDLTTSECQEYLEIILINLYNAFLNRKTVKIPKSESYYAKKFGANGGEICEKIKFCLEQLQKRVLIGEVTGNKIFGYSRFWAKADLIQLFIKYPIDFSSTERAKSCVIMKNSSKEIIDFPLSDKTQIINDTLEKINSFLASQKFTYTPLQDYTVELFPQLVAIFNNSSWEEGGRLYDTLTSKGIIYQNIPSDLRRTICINGNPTVELDYSGLHITMLYAMQKIQGPSEPYSFLPEEQKPVAKFATLLMINAANEEQVIFLLRETRDELRGKLGLSEKKKKQQNAFNKCSDDDFCDIIQKIKKQHHLISEEFFSKKGLELQNKDSQMALAILEFFYKKGIPVLPMHDSFIIEEQYLKDLKETMKSVFKKYNNNFTCQIR